MKKDKGGARRGEDGENKVWRGSGDQKKNIIRVQN